MDRVEYQTMVIQDLINHHKADELNLTPWYQRRAVWTRPQKAYLINTIFENKPVPSIYIRHYLDVEKEKSIKEVVDGQQRIRAILEFAGGDFAARHPGHKKPVTYGELSSSQKGAFRMTSLSVGTLIGATDPDVIEIFGRLNSVAKTLNRQEKRNARFSGEFKQFCLKQAAVRLSIWRDLHVFTANDIARMNEVQFVSELAINIRDGLSDYSAAKIDDTYRDCDEAFPRRDDIEARMDRVFTKIAEIQPRAIRDTIFCRAPLFFTLFLVLDSLKAKMPNDRLEGALNRIDQVYNSDTPVAERSKRDTEFYVACTSNMHRIKSRKVRDAYLRAFLS